MADVPCLDHRLECNGSLLVTGRPSYLKQKSTIFHVFRGVYSCSNMPGTPSALTQFTSKPKFSGYQDITPQHPGILLEATGQLKTSHTT